jgi:hypothetical protein
MFIVFCLEIILSRRPQEDLGRAMVEERICLHMHDVKGLEARETDGGRLMKG